MNFLLSLCLRTGLYIFSILTRHRGQNSAIQEAPILKKLFENCLEIWLNDFKFQVRLKSVISQPTLENSIGLLHFHLIKEFKLILIFQFVFL